MAAGSARIEIFHAGNKNKKFPAMILDQVPVQVAAETTANTATVAGSRIAVAPTGSDRDFFARITADVVMFVAVGTNPTAAITAAPASGWRIMANSFIVLPVKRGDLFSFINLV